MKRIVIFIALCVIAISISAQGARINNSWLEHGVNGGMRIHVNMDVWDLQYCQVDVICFIWHENGKKVYSTDGFYQARDRQVCTAIKVTPNYQSSNWSDLQLWIPVTQITDSKNRRNYKCRIEVFYNHNFLVAGDYMNFAAWRN